MPVVVLVGQPAQDHAPHDRHRSIRCRIEDRPIGRGPLEIPGRRLALHGADDVAAFAHLPQRGFEPLGEPPAIAREMLGNPQPAELQDAPHAAPAGTDPHRLRRPRAVVHVPDGLYFGSYKAPRELVWMLGLVILLLLMATAFMGYLLPWGQMSFWGAQAVARNTTKRCDAFTAWRTCGLRRTFLLLKEKLYRSV